MKRLLLALTIVLLLASQAFAGHYRRYNRGYGGRGYSSNYSHNYNYHKPVYHQQHFVQPYIIRQFNEFVVEKTPVVNIQVFAPHDRLDFTEEAVKEQIFQREFEVTYDNFGRRFITQKDVLVADRLTINEVNAERFQTRVVKLNGLLFKEVVDFVENRVIFREPIIEQNRETQLYIVP